MRRGTAIIDLTNCKTWGELFSRIKKSLNFPEFCGENWSALKDSLYSYLEHTKIIIKGTNTVASDMKECIVKMLEIFSDFKEECDKYNWEFEYEVADSDGE